MASKPDKSVCTDKPVLIVDDDADIREILQEVLQHEGYTVESACNGREALERVEAMRPSLIVLDLTMPVMGGAEFLEHFRQLDMAGATPVLVLTARNEAGPAPWKKTAHGIFRKPVDVEVLLDAIQQAVRAA